LKEAVEEIDKLTPDGTLGKVINILRSHNLIEGE
jgi:hypothetical protein